MVDNNISSWLSSLGEDKESAIFKIIEFLKEYVYANTFNSVIKDHGIDYEMPKIKSYYYKRKQVLELIKYLYENKKEQFSSVIEDIINNSTKYYTEDEINKIVLDFKILGYEATINQKEIKLKTIRGSDFKERIYGSYSKYDFYKDIENLISNIKSELFLIDPYLTKKAFNIYVGDNAAILKNCSIKILITEKRSKELELENLKSVITMFNKQYNNIELKKSEFIHDRSIFIDNKAFVFGQSLDDDEGKKPTYLIRISDENFNQLRKIADDMWDKGQSIIK